MKKHFLLVVIFAFSAPSFAKDEKPVQGGIPAKAIDAAIKKKMPRILECYNKETKKIGKVGEGTVKTRLTINAEGKVSKAEVKESSLENPAVEDCLIFELKGVEFPKPEGGGTVEVHYPFKFGKKSNLDRL